jgi:hypothetical protein
MIALIVMVVAIPFVEAVVMVMAVGFVFDLDLKTHFVAMIRRATHVEDSETR